ncbi:T9SS type A sorting domain-containing protein [candidate division WOR-3 bacterium]|nr:T9SS type A sorting domain-containing protein [candidate division WOR-3 bacterium]
MSIIFLFWLTLSSNFAQNRLQQTTPHNPVGNKVSPYITFNRTQHMEKDTVDEHDVGTDAIIAPVGTLHAGDTIIPRATIRNLGTSTEHYFDVRFRIGIDYDATVMVNSLPPFSVIEITFPIWIARTGTYPVSCSTQLTGDINPENDKITRTITVSEVKNLTIEPDQSDTIQLGQRKSYRFYAQLDADTGYIVELKPPTDLSGWTALLLDSNDQTPLTDSDGDGNPELGFVSPGERHYFNLGLLAPTALIGTPAVLKDTVVFSLYGFLANDTIVEDSVRLKITIRPELDIHNYPNPFNGRTTFVISLPEPGAVTLTVYLRTGEQVCRIFQAEPLAAGVHFIPWDGKNNQEQPLTPGTYYYLLEYQNGNRVKKIQKKLVIHKD